MAQAEALARRRCYPPERPSSIKLTLRRGMFAKFLDIVTGKDDVERVASKEDVRLLNNYLRTRRLFFPKKPRRFLDAETFTQQELMELIEQEGKELGGNEVELWILDVNGKKHLPAFSSHKKMQTFSAKISQEMNKVFALGCIEVLLADITKTAD